MPVERSELRRGPPVPAPHAAERLASSGLVLPGRELALTVIRPHILGHATNIIVAGSDPAGINFGDWTVLLEALVSIVRRGSFLHQASSSPASCSAHARCWRDVEDKLNRLPSPTSTVNPRRSAPRHQRHRQRRAEPPADAEQMLTSGLTIIGVVIMMISISPLLAIIHPHHRSISSSR
jgi:ATP-binding cassette subfamily B protein